MKNLVTNSLPTVSDDEDVEFTLDPTEEEIKLEARKTELAEALLEVSTTANSISSDVVRFMCKLEDEFSAIVSEVKAMESAVNDSLIKEDGSYREDLLDEDEVEMLHRHEEENQRRNEDMSSKKAKKPASEGSKRVYKKIAQICHPDKFKKDDPLADLKNQLFLQAKRAYAEDNYELLSKIYKCAVLGLTFRCLVLKQDIETLEKDLHLMSNTLQNLLHQKTTQWCLGVKRFPFTMLSVRHQFISHLKERKKAAQLKLQLIKNKGAVCR